MKVTHQSGSRDPELAKKIGAAVALEVRATGIPYVFAPCVAVCICIVDLIINILNLTSSYIHKRYIVNYFKLCAVVNKLI